MGGELGDADSNNINNCQTDHPSFGGAGGRLKTERNMKKTYMIPVMETIDMKMSCTLLAGSMPKGTTPVTDEGGVLSRDLDLFLED